MTAAPPSLTPASQPAKRKPWFLLGCGGLIVIVLLIVAVGAGMVWWSQRPHQAVKLSAAERQVVDAKLRDLGQPQAERDATPSPTPNPPAPAEPDRPYQPGSKVIRLTEREVNGLLNDNTDLGQRVKIEFARDAVNAHIALTVPEDFPVAAGRTLRVKGRIRASVGGDGKPVAVLEDLSVFGLSLPQAWLPVKGQNLLESNPASGDMAPILRGIKSLRIEPGALVLEVND